MWCYSFHSGNDSISDDIAILANIPVQAETLLHTLALASMSMHTKRNTCASIKQATFPH